MLSVTNLVVHKRPFFTNEYEYNFENFFDSVSIEEQKKGDYEYRECFSENRLLL